MDTASILVALLAEGVDRNFQPCKKTGLRLVALLAEGVDRNALFLPMRTTRKPSPSSRRAWIEIHRLRQHRH